MKINKLTREICIISLLIILSIYVYAIDPSAPTSINNISSHSPNTTAGHELNTSGGSITTLNINATTVNLKWKGYVGNVSGELALLDSTLSALYKWDLVTITGEIYATRNSSLLSWDSIECATLSVIADEQVALNITSNSSDSINNTFDTTTHDEFYVGSTKISSNSCRAIALNVNNTVQTDDFQEILLTDGSSLIYTSLLENLL